MLTQTRNPSDAVLIRQQVIGAAHIGQSQQSQRPGEHEALDNGSKCPGAGIQEIIVRQNLPWTGFEPKVEETNADVKEVRPVRVARGHRSQDEHAEDGGHEDESHPHDKTVSLQAPLQ